MPIQIRITWLAILLTATCASWAQEEPGPADSTQETVTDQPASTEIENSAKQEKAGKQGTWLTDMEQAKNLAAKTGKPILMDFTGSDWCSWCVKLTDEVFSQQEFTDWADKNLILVELDFPSDESRLPAEVREHHDKWLKDLQVEGFPSVVLVDQEARPFAQTGYKEGGPAEYIKHLTQLLQVRLLRDTAMGLADEAEGADKARFLNDALATLDKKIAGLHYKNEIETIQKLGDERLQKKYAQLLLDVQGGAETAGMDREDWMSDPFGFLGADMTSASDSLNEVLTEPPVDEYHPRIEKRLAKLIELMNKT